MSTRRLALACLALGGLAFFQPVAQAWSWNFGSGERVQGSGEIVSEARSPGSFDGVSLSGSFKVLVRQAGSEAVEIKADKNLLPLIETRVVENGKGRILEISAKRGYQLQPSKTPMITLEMAVLRQLAIAGSGDIKVETMKTPQLDASVAGSGDIVFNDLQSERLGIKVSGSGDVQAAGRANSLTVAIAGSGDVKAQNLVADEVKVSIAGSGDARVHANKTLKVSIAGSGDVRYNGAPNIESSVAGSGSVRKLGD